MSGRRAKQLRLAAARATVGAPAEETERVYKQMKRSTIRASRSMNHGSKSNGPRVTVGAEGFDSRILIRNGRHAGRILRFRQSTYRERIRQSRIGKFLRDE